MGVRILSLLQLKNIYSSCDRECRQQHLSSMYPIELPVAAYQPHNMPNVVLTLEKWNFWFLSAGWHTEHRWDPDSPKGFTSPAGCSRFPFGSGLSTNPVDYFTVRVRSHQQCALLSSLLSRGVSLQRLMRENLHLSIVIASDLSFRNEASSSWKKEEPEIEVI